MSHIAPGMRIEMRSVEWLVKRTSVTGMKLHLIEAVGLTDIVRDKEIAFIQEYERAGSVKVLDPADVTLTPDPSPFYAHTLLYLESLLRTAAPQGQAIAVGDRAAIDVLDYQLQPARMALQASRPRILIADDVGLGKTIEAGILVSEMIARGQGKRILAVTTKAMLTQFQQEFWIRFAIALTRMDSNALQRIKERIPERHNPFHYFDRAIVSIDTLKNNRRFGAAIENAVWDIVIIDEAQNVAARKHARGGSQRSRLAQILAPRTDALLLLSATPHDGSRESFASLMQMLSPLAIPDVKEYGPEDIKGLYVRRFRHSPEVKACLAEDFPERRTWHKRYPASEREEEAFRLLAELDLMADRNVQRSNRLFRIVLEKALFSSPKACLGTLGQRIRRHEREIEAQPNATEARHDLRQLQRLHASVAAISAAEFSRYQGLLAFLREQGWTGRDSGDRLVIFTERLDTVAWLQKNLARDLGLAGECIRTMSGEMNDLELNDAKEAFGQGESPVRLLIASDIAAEGLNLHFQCHRLVHFDLPWSLMTFQQRNGRIDRYGQKERPQVAYLCTTCREQRIHNDLRILEILSRKEDQARSNIGDPAVLVGTQDPDEQERIVADAMEQRTLPDAFDAALEIDQRPPAASEYDLLESILSGAAWEEDADDGAEPVPAAPTLFPSFFDYVADALGHLKAREGLRLQVHRGQRVIEVEAPAALQDPVSDEPLWMPREAVKEGLVRLTDRRELAQAAMERALASANSWPDTQFLWEIHPFAEWLGDQMQRLFKRREVPVIRLPQDLDPKEAIFLFFGRAPNQAGSTLLDAWIGVRFRDGACVECMDMQAVLQAVRLRPGQNVNDGRTAVADLEPLIDAAVQKAKERFRALIAELQERVDTEALKEAESLEALEQKHRARIARKFALRGGIERVLAAERKKEEEQVKQWVQQFWDWYERERKMEAHAQPMPQLIAAFRG